MKLSEVDDDAFIYTDSTIKIKGITSEYVSSIGTSYGEIKLSNDISIMHKFHIVPNEFSISAQGILGKDFFSKFKVKINYETSLLTIPVHNSTLTFKMTNPHEIVVPLRSEFITKIRTHFSQPKICFNKEIKPGLLSSNCIVDPKNGICTISLINSSEISQSFHSSDLEFDDLENYHVIDPINISDESRISLLESQTDTIHMNSKEQQSILDICQNYNELFPFRR
ncbi:hypothetical protein JTB14_003172 [Gonioctena quinquepunctata]|nr:hypothetical protein JTB14_003172 [Gonioctena quinquepunctata]